MQLDKKTRAFFVAQGRKGGLKVSKKRGKSYYSELGKLGSAKRWQNTHRAGGVDSGKISPPKS